MAEISYSYSRVRKDFGRPVEFQPNEPETITDIAPNQELKEQFVAVDPYETEVQNVAQLTESQTNTERISLKHQGQMHNEGGWPIGIDPTEFEEKLKYCKKAERDESYYTACKSLVDRCMEKNLKQNNAIDIYGSYFPDQVADQSLGPPSVKTATVFKDPSPVKRAAVQLSWLSDGKKLAVAYCNLRFQGNIEGMSTASHIWDVTNPNEPCETLVPQSPLCCIEYYGKDPHLIAGGSYNGVVQYWDTRTPKRPVGRSAIEESHKDAVWDIKWLQSKSGEILSVSTDGQAFIWDCRKPEKPTEVMTIKKFEQESLLLQPKTNEGGAKGVLGGTCIDYDAQIGGPTKYMIGTEQGTVLSCNRKGKSMQDKIGSNVFNGHHGPVYGVQRNPQHPKYFLTVGDWTARLWCEDFKGSAMYTTFYHKAHLTHGCWHPQRAGVFFTTRMDGYMDVWDLQTRQSTSVLSVQVSDYALHTIKPTPEGRHIAVGAVDGTTTLLEVSPSLYTTSSSEKTSIGKMFENESTRDKNLQSQQRAKEKSKGKKQPQTRDRDGAGVDESELQTSAESFLKNVETDEDAQKKELESLEAKRAKLLEDIEDGMEIDDEQ
jgi:dynein intermediate chain 2